MRTKTFNDDHYRGHSHSDHNIDPVLCRINDDSHRHCEIMIAMVCQVYKVAFHNLIFLSLGF